ncbi:hypothetical protein KY290_008038 [Solanum tuberosum]|uniref:Uncharacterized protein n=1 Tax=Solanum tuberosum TaxID=4113 RepID=A0ABQ7W9Z5_SOLTU|nr:hypothetical protein KY290_008038 [Solanum tuberosum]
MMRKCHSRIITWPSLHKEADVEIEEAIISIRIEASNYVKDQDLDSNVCQLCRRNNHTTIKCFYRWDYSYQVVEDLPQALATVNFQDTQAEDNAMYVDSGATNHRTNNKGNLSDLKTYNGTNKINVGNGPRLNITHVWNTTRSGVTPQKFLS